MGIRSMSAADLMSKYETGGGSGGGRPRRWGIWIGLVILVVTGIVIWLIAK